MIKELMFITVIALYAFQTNAQRLLTYEQAVGIALNESYTIQSHAEELKAMEYSYLYYKAQFKPRIDLNLFSPSWSENVTAVERADGLPVYNSVGDMKFGGDLAFTYVLPTGGDLSLNTVVYHQQVSASLAEQDYLSLKRKQAFNQFGIWFNQPLFTKNKLKENLKEAGYKYEKSRHVYTRIQMDIIYRVTESFYALYKCKYQKQINEERLKNSEEAYRIAQLKLGTGDLPEAEVMNSEVVMAQDNARLLESGSMLETQKDKFKLLIGLDMKEEIDIIADTEFETVLIDLQTAIDEALKNRLEIRESELDIHLQEIEVDRAKREREIKGSLQAYYDFTGVSTRTNTLGDRFASAMDNLSERPANRGVTFTVSVPIADWGRGKNKTRYAQTQLNAQKLYAENLQHQIVQEIREIARTVSDAETRVHINRKNSEVAAQSYKVAQMRFRNGDISSLELAISQDQLATVQLSFIESFITYQMSLTDLKRKTMWDFENNRSYKAIEN
ncbi:MAG: TolC family protein [Tannerella sp.]|jgi:outer membrane protein TolC|nr:TolC family protein [Tannerella sp.]